jgi:hypothetical protein
VTSPDRERVLHEFALFKDLSDFEVGALADRVAT